MPLTARWTPLIPLPVQLAYRDSKHRFNVVPAGRRSGKTERAKRRLIRKALQHNKPWPGRYGFCAPTRDQAKQIYWGDLKLLVPKNLMLEEPSESHLSVTLVNGSVIQVVGLDKPERIEGSPWDHLVLDEYGNMKKEVWTYHVRPALSDRRGGCDFIGVPEGRNHYYNLWSQALLDTSGDWGAYTWLSSQVLDVTNPGEVEAARRDLDPLTFQQEYEGSFVSFSGQAYYAFNQQLHYHKCAHLYDRHQPLILCFDFNVSPGVANILQELPHPNIKGPMRKTAKPITLCIGEVHIPRNSNTVAVCNRIAKDWGNHAGRVICYGDSTGGNRGTAKLQGSDWDIIRDELRPVFKERLSFRVKKSNPSERARVNAVNTRLKSASGEVRFVIDPETCKYTIRDFEGVVVLAGGSGEIDKTHDPELTHHTDAIGYYIEREFPTAANGIKVEELLL